MYAHYLRRKHRLDRWAVVAGFASCVVSCGLPTYSGSGSSDGGTGGGDASTAAPGAPCIRDSDCASNVCGANGRCSASTCSDGIQNQGERDIDCGGTYCDPCDNNKKCLVGPDCRSGSCVSGICHAPTCADAVKNGTETAIDCGGLCATTDPISRCGNGMACASASDCVSGVCIDRVCQAPACQPVGDQVTNGTETDLDCGGSGCPACADGKRCAVGTDCASGLCTGQHCAVPSCVPPDLVKNGTETDIDCGGMGCPGCGSGKACAVGKDCESGVCAGVPQLCQPSTCPDGVKNQGETDIDCGGPTCAVKCPAGKTCAADADCATGLCIGGTCSDGSCEDNRRDGLETDIDCGGATCRGLTKLCRVGEGCAVSADCAAAGECTTTGKCTVATCTNGVKDPDESAVDCGGAVCAKCAEGKACNNAADCASGVCSGSPTKTCQRPSCSPPDGVENGTETAIDCGGAGCPTCADGKACNASSDCASQVCSGGICQVPTCAPPDKVMNGGETDIDCGGAICSIKCVDGKACRHASDCVNAVCFVSSGVGATSLRNTCSADTCAGGSCRSNSCSDGLWGGNESDVDCGGSCPKCADGKNCLNADDCLNAGACSGGVCQPPTCSDGLQNQGETDVDCGGTQTPSCPRCSIGQACKVAGDCGSGICTDGHCSPIKLQYHQYDGNPNDAQVYPFFRVVNRGTTAISYGQIKIRYWYNKDGSTSFTPECFAAPMGCERVNVQFYALSPARSGADHYAEVSFTPSLTIAPGAQSSDIVVRFYHTNWSPNFNEAGHYSYGTSSTYVDWERITVYLDNKLVWGVEPQ